VTVIVNSWLGSIGVTINGESDVDEGVSESEVDEVGNSALAVGASGVAVPNVVSGAGCRVPVG